MAVLKIGLTSSYSYKFTVILEQVTYQIRFNWLDKEDAWYLDLYDRFGEPLILGHKVLYSNSVLRKYHARAGVPQGEFFLLGGESGELVRPSFDSVSGGDSFYYITSDELG